VVLSHGQELGLKKHTARTVNVTIKSRAFLEPVILERTKAT